jgi:hypothetical protein
MACYRERIFSFTYRPIEWLSTFQGSPCMLMLLGCEWYAEILKRSVIRLVPLHICQRQFVLNGKLSLTELGAFSRCIERHNILYFAFSSREKIAIAKNTHFCRELKIFLKFHKLSCWKSDLFGRCFSVCFLSLYLVPERSSRVSSICVWFLYRAICIMILYGIRDVLMSRSINTCHTLPILSHSSPYPTSAQYPIGSWYITPEFKLMNPIIISLYEINLDRKTKTKLRGFGPPANYTDRATSACWRI